jgi:hypothetical protein
MVQSSSQRPGDETSLRFHAMPYVEWSAVFAGAVVAMAVSFVLLTFGGAVGLSAVSPWTSTRGTVTAVGLGAAFWLILVNVWAFALGGYLAGRMRHRHSGASQSEAYFRDGTHGVVVWAFSVTAAAMIAALAATSLAKGGVEAAATAARSSNADPVSIATDTLLRTSAANPNARTEDLRTEVNSLLARSVASGGISAPDRTYLASVVAARAGVQQPEAEARVDRAIAQMKEATDKARKVTVVFGFLTAATMLLGAAAAWWGATTGGQHRDQDTVWEGLGTRRFTDVRRGALP